MKNPAILVVEDNPISRKMVRVTLETEGYSVVEAPDARTALALFESAAPDLVLQDLLLPDMDGFELARDLRALPRGAEVPIIAVSGFLSRREEAQVEAMGFSDFLSKPLEPERLLETVRAHFPDQLPAPEDVREGARVLAVDDDPIQLKLMRIRLGLAGFRVSCASDGQEALEMAREDPPDAVLSDVVMPRLDGFRLCLALRSDPRLARIPVVLVSASYLDGADDRFAQDVGASALIPRKSDFEEAITAVRASLAAEAPQPLEASEIGSEHVGHVIRRLERQAALTQSLARRNATQAAALGVLSGIAETLARTQDVHTVLSDVLARCADAGGMSLGALYLIAADGGFRLEACQGYADSMTSHLEAAFGHPDLLREVLARGVAATIPSAQVPNEVASDFLKEGVIASAVIVPIISHEERLGVLLLASRARVLEEGDWLVFARTVAAQVGQAVALTKAVAGIAASESRYRGLMENAGDAITILDSSGMILEANRQAVETLGYSLADIVGRNGLDFVVPDERAESRDLLARLAQEGATRTENRHMLRADGSVLPVDLSSSLVDVGGQRLVFTIARDVTQRAAAEHALRKLSSAVEQSPEAVFITDKDGVIEYVNPAFEKQTGYSREEALGRKPALLKSGEHSQAFYESLWNTILSGKTFRAVFANRRKSGEIVYEEKAIAPLRDEAGNITNFVSTGRDITERRELEESLRQSEELHRAILESLDEIVYAVRLDPGEAMRGTVEFVSGRVEEVLGNSSKDFIEDPGLWMSLLHPEDGPRVAAGTEQGLRDGQPLVREYRLRHKLTGQYRWMEDRVVWRTDEAGRVVAFVGAARDVTGRKHAEAALEESRQQLFQSQKVEAIGQLAGGIAHDFNNMLFAISAFGELALRELGASHPANPRVRQMLKAAERAAGLTKQLLAFSRKQVLQSKPMDLNDVVRNVETMLGRLLGEDIDFVVSTAAGLGIVVADPGQIEQVLMNLAVNARDAMPKGGRLTIETGNAEIDEAHAAGQPPLQPGRYVMVEVSDAGIGMDAATQARIFEPFFTTKPEGEGTGLGLATVYGIVKQSGGYIWVSSEPGEGTTFKVYLPRVDARAGAEGVASARVVPAGGHETVMLVEDLEDVREAIREMLEQNGYTVLLASNGEEALALAQEHVGPIDLLLTDVVMPQLGGRELADQVHALRPGIRVLYMSGYPKGWMSKRGGLVAGIALLEKPFSEEQLLLAVREALERPLT